MSLYDDYFSKRCDYRLAAVTRPCFLRLWNLLCEILPIDLRPGWLFNWMTCNCDSCMEHATTEGEAVGHGFWHWTSHDQLPSLLGIRRGK